MYTSTEGLAALQATQSASAAMQHAYQLVIDLEWEWGKVKDSMQWHSPAWEAAQQRLGQISLKLLMARYQVEQCQRTLDSANAYYAAIV